MFAATSVQQSFALVVAFVVAVGFVLWLLANVRRAKPEIGSELELAANRRPYFDDEGMEGKRLDNVLRWALVSLTIIAVGLPVYWLAEPGRQAHAKVRFTETFAKRGSQLFAVTAEGGFNCAGCHGGVSGGQVPYTITDPVTKKLKQITWKAPSLDDVVLRMSDEQLREVLTYGRPFSPMPAWGLLGGGPMNDQQIDNLIGYLHSVAISPKEAKQRAATNMAAELKRLQDPQSALTAAQQSLATVTDAAEKLKIESQITELEGIIATKQEASPGAALFNLNCSRCHTLGWSFFEPTAPGSGAFGPPLANVINQFPAAQDQIDFVTAGKKFGEKYGRQGKASGRMPFFSALLTEDQIKAIVNYERELSKQRQEKQ
jgi:mono/diheme cytochrome c family protein